MREEEEDVITAAGQVQLAQHGFILDSTLTHDGTLVVLVSFQHNSHTTLVKSHCLDLDLN